MKPTDLWGDHPPGMTYRSCSYGDDCHRFNTDQANGGLGNMDGIQEYTRDPAKRAKVPFELSESIRDAVEAAIEGPTTEQATLVTDGGHDQHTEGDTHTCFTCGHDVDLQAEEWWSHSWEEHPSYETIEESLEHDEFRDWFRENKILCSACHKDVIAKVLDIRDINDVEDGEEVPSK